MSDEPRNAAVRFAALSLAIVTLRASQLRAQRAGDIVFVDVVGSELFLMEQKRDQLYAQMEGAE